jgi:hypothetical protein
MGSQIAVKLSASQINRALLHRNILNSVSGSHFSSRLSKPQGLEQQDGLGKFKQLVGSQTSQENRI